MAPVSQISLSLSSRPQTKAEEMEGNLEYRSYTPHHARSLNAIVPGVSQWGYSPWNHVYVL